MKEKHYRISIPMDDIRMLKFALQSLEKEIREARFYGPSLKLKTFTARMDPEYFDHVLLPQLYSLLNKLERVIPEERIPPAMRFSLNNVERKFNSPNRNPMAPKKAKKSVKKVAKKKAPKRK